MGLCAALTMQGDVQDHSFSAQRQVPRTLYRPLGDLLRDTAAGRPPEPITEAQIFSGAAVRAICIQWLSLPACLPLPAKGVLGKYTSHQ